MSVTQFNQLENLSRGLPARHERLNPVALRETRSGESVLIKVVKDKKDDNAGFVILTENRTVMQLTKDEIKELIGKYKIKIKGLTLTSDNRLLFNKKELDEIKGISWGFNVTPDNLYLTVKEAKRLIVDTITRIKYKGFSVDGTGNNIAVSFDCVRNYVSLDTYIKTNKSEEEVKAINYIQEYPEFIPRSFQNIQMFMSDRVIVGYTKEGGKVKTIDRSFILPVEYNGADVVTRRFVARIMDCII